MINIRNFFIALFISLIAFSLIAWLLMENILPKEEENNKQSDTKLELKYSDEAPVVNETEEVVEKNQTVTGMICFIDDYSKRADSIALISFNKDLKTVTFCTVPSYLEIDIGTAEEPSLKRLGDLLVDQNTDDGNELDLDTFEGFKNRVAAVTGLEIDYYAYLTSSSFVKVMKEFGDVEYDVPETMYYKDKDTGKVLVDLNENDSLLNGKDALQLLRFRSYKDTPENDDGDTRRRETQALFAKTVLDSFLTADVAAVFNDEANQDSETVTTFRSKLKKIISAIPASNTNFDVYDFETYSDLILHYPEYEFKIVDYPVNKTDIVQLENDEVLAVHTPDYTQAYVDLNSVEN